jgi:hypothetical protein
VFQSRQQPAQVYWRCIRIPCRRPRPSGHLVLLRHLLDLRAANALNIRYSQRSSEAAFRIFGLAWCGGESSALRGRLSLFRRDSAALLLLQVSRMEATSPFATSRRTIVSLSFPALTNTHFITPYARFHIHVVANHSLSARGLF